MKTIIQHLLIMIPTALISYCVGVTKVVLFESSIDGTATYTTCLQDEEGFDGRKNCLIEDEMSQPITIRAKDAGKIAFFGGLGLGWIIAQVVLPKRVIQN